MKITTLVENECSSTAKGLISEWGLSLHIEFNGHSILFDTGKSGAFAKNAKRLNIDLHSVQVMVLSHHHFDHGGGLKKFLNINPRAKVYLANFPVGECHAKVFKFFKKYIGLDNSIISENPKRFVTVNKSSEILPNVFVFPNIVTPHPKPAGNKQLYLKRDGTLIHDDFSHEIVMAIRDEEGLVIFTGCSHNGLLNMVDTVAREFEGIPIKGVVGGFHLVSSPPFTFMAGNKHEVEQIGRALVNYPVEKTYTGHCTGAKAFQILKSVMGNQLSDIKTGSCIEI